MEGSNCTEKGCEDCEDCELEITVEFEGLVIVVVVVVVITDILFSSLTLLYIYNYSQKISLKFTFVSHDNHVLKLHICLLKL